ncbi:MAG: orotidine-5'-phosphate decarboxylase, partial [Sodaliphilus sp.]|nr:orotidine-5'-phosphate decarboxylase [Sodaliphilus sp.]
MNRQELFNQIKNKRSFLCVGLDPDLDKMPKSLNGDLFAFNKAIIDATAQYAVAFKPNLAFYEVQGVKGLQAFEDTVKYIRERYPEIMIIADAKRGDIGNTSKMYAKSFFETMNVDALTVAPYMGEDSVTPFLSY